MIKCIIILKNNDNSKKLFYIATQGNVLRLIIMAVDLDLNLLITHVIYNEPKVVTVFLNIAH